MRQPIVLVRHAVELLTMGTPEFIPPTLWPPNSPGLNPVNYSVVRNAEGLQEADQGH